MHSFKKSVLGFLSVQSLLTASAMAADPCIPPAVKAAEEAYSNDPDRVRAVTVTQGVRYKVTVGIGNPEDGAHLYLVWFPAGCSSKPEVREAPMVPIHPMQKIVQAAYNQVLWANDDLLPASLRINPSQLPARAQKDFSQRTSQGEKVAAFQVPVQGHPTFGVMALNANDSIKAYLDVFDAAGRDIDSAETYHDTSVGAKGVTWQDSSVQR